MMNQTPLINQLPNLQGYLDEADLNELITQHTEAELIQLDLAFDTIEAAMIRIHRHLEPGFDTRFATAISTIWDNARDLLDAD